MTRVSFEDIKFHEENDCVKAVFLQYYYFFIEKSDLEKIGCFKIVEDAIEFDATDKKVTNKFNRILKKGLDELKSVLGKEAVYVHAGSAIPLIGTNEFGIVDRDTNIIEVKPHSICNLDCIYCSVDAGKSSKKIVDFVVEEKYLVEEFNKVSSLKKNPVEASINPQGEPLMYSRIVELVKDLKTCSNVKTVSINTNGLLLTKKLVDELIKAGLDRINLSINTVSQKTADKLSGSKYPVEKIKRIMTYCDGKIELLLAPLIVPGYNDSEIREFLEFCKTLKTTPRFGFQNFLNYERGRNPVKSKGMDWFLKLLKDYESRFKVRLINSKEDYEITDDSKIPKPFKKGQVIDAIVTCPGKYRGELICVADDRCITVKGDFSKNTNLRLKVVRDKHNIFKGVVI
ncbi:MAG: radical SAM protein [Nanoarchaeota archaeon]|nr:radical SAM protein [Nanoarchaeota archaeon]MBU1269065.1 radical SAM protein [Nanoarchaeota archaeon]MBU1604960.1 radical SAM protein [Nanoarchaeota archaeon]MBU2443310.1 radical SAM protein [Nanoarchaeota archaeon]